MLIHPGLFLEQIKMNLASHNFKPNQTETQLRIRYVNSCSPYKRICVGVIAFASVGKLEAPQCWIWT